MKKRSSEHPVRFGKMSRLMVSKDIHVNTIKKKKRK